MDEITPLKKTGHPLKEIDWKKVDDLMIAGCLGTEIAAFFGIHPDTFYKRVELEKGMGFSAYLQKMHSKGESILRAHQYAKSIGLTDKGDNTLLIWLGKTRLKQRDVNVEAPLIPNDKKLEELIENLKNYKDALAQKEASSQKPIEENPDASKPETNPELSRSDETL